MASEEQNNRQREFNDFLEREIELRAENQAFLGETISKSAQLADQIKHTVGLIKNKIELDKQVLKVSKDNVNAVSRLSASYDDISSIQKDRAKVEKQMVANANIMAARQSNLTKELGAQAAIELEKGKAFVQQEKALEAQQKKLEEQINAAERLKAEQKARIAAGEQLDSADRALLHNAKQAVKTQQRKTAQTLAEFNAASKLVDPRAVEVALLEEQNQNLEKAVGYLDEEDSRLTQIVKNQALWNVSLGAVEGFFNKIGLKGATLSLGLEEGSAAAEEMAKKLSNGGEESLGLLGQIRVLGAGAMGTFKGMAKGLKQALSLAVIGKLFGKGLGALLSPVTGFIKDLKSKFTEGISYLKEQFFSLNSYIEDAKVGDNLRLQLSQATADLATDLGVGTAEAKKLTEESKKIGREIGMLPEELAKTTAELNKAFGTTQKFSQDTVKTMGQLTHQFGLTNEEASEFVKLSQLSGKETSDFTLETKTRVQALKEASNIAISEKAVMQEIAKSSAAIQLSSKGQGKNLADAAFHAKKLGLSLAQTEAIGGSLLDFESSIANEMEAELLIGRDLNLDKARQFALNNDIAGVAKEIAGQIGSAAEFGKMNVIQQEALAKSVGVSRDELADMLKTQELLAGTGFNEMSDAQEKFKELLKETGSEEAALAKLREGGASAALAEQIRVKSAQEERILQERAIADQQMAMAIEAGKLFTAFLNVKKQVKEIKKTVVDQMGPFFNSFADLIGDGGDVFQNKVLPYAKQLGKFMNDVGLRLTDIVKNNGPAISSIFSGVLDLFGSIYSVVGGVIKQLLGINNASATSSSFFESINDTIQSMVEKLKNVDISALTEKIKTFIQGVKDTFISIKEGIMQAVDFVKNSALGQFLSGDAGKMSVAVAPIAFKGFKMGKDAFDGIKGLLGMKKGESESNPLYVSDVSGGGGNDMMGNLMKAGGRKAGIGGGFKKGFKGLMDYAKMAVKGGRAGKVGRARIARAAKGLVTGKGASFVGGTGKGSAQAAKAAGKLAGVAGKLGSVGKTLGKLAAGGGIGAIVGLAAEATLGHFKKKAEAAADAMEDGEKRDKKLRQARALGVAAETAKYAGYGAAIGTMIGGPFGTAIGGGIGALVGFTKGMIDAKKARKREESAAGKFAREQRKAAEKHAKALTNIELKSAALQAKAAKEGFAKEQEVRLQFAEQLGVSGETAVEKLAQLKDLDIDYTSDAFRKLATDALNAGNITEKEFAAALKGTISPLDLMEKSAQTSSTNLKKLYNSAIETASALSNELKNSILEQAGVNEDVINSQVNAVEAFTKTADIQSMGLFEQFEDDLKAGAFDSEAVDTLRGEDDQSKAFQTALIKKFEDQGADADQVKLAMELYANQLEAAGEDFDLDDAADIATAIEGIGGSLVKVLQSPVLLAEAESSSKQSTALTQIDESGILKVIGNLSKEQLDTNAELKSVLESVGINLEEVASKDGKIDSDELQSLKESLTEGITAGLMGVEGSNPDLLAQLQSAVTLDDFILRPGSAPLKFNEGDLLIGGTQLNKGLGGTNENTVKLQVEPSNIDLNNYIVLPNIIDLNNYVTISNPIDLNNFIFPPNPIDLNNFIFPPNPIDLNNFIIYPEPLDLGNYLIPPLPIMMDSYIFPPTPIELNNFILSPDIIDLNSYIEILDILLNSYIQIAEIDITPYITVDDINLNQYINQLINLNDYIGEDIDLLGKLLPIDLTQIMKMNAEETASLQAQLSEANSQLENKSIVEKIASTFAESFRSITGETAEDFISRPGQPLQKFRADDLVIGGTNLKGNNENPSQSTEKLEQELQDLKQIMSGFVEQMGQVVNRPITVELNGNKVGQALGQDSYKIQ